MRRVVLELLVIALAVGGFYAWRHRPAPPPPPLFAGEPPKLDVPPSRVAPPRPGPDGVLVQPDSGGAPAPRAFDGLEPVPAPAGSTPQLIPGAGAAPPAPLDEPDAAARLTPPPAAAKTPTWLDKAATPGGALVVFVVLAALYFAASRGLMRVPHDRDGA